MKKLLAGLLLAAIFVAGYTWGPSWLPQPVPEAAAQTTLPLAASTDISFVGKFAIPPGDCGTHSPCYGGYGLSFWKDGSNRKTLFMAGNDQSFSWVGQWQVPADGSLKSAGTAWGSLTQAAELQSMHDIASTFSGFDPGNGNPDWLIGTMVYNGRLILCGSNSYSFNQTKSCGVWDQPSNLAASVSTNFHGFYASTASAQPRSLGGYIIAIPSAWQSALGGPMFVGNCCLSVISTTSFGPSLTVINPDDIGVTTPYPGTTLLEYPGPGTQTICRANECEATQNVYFNLVSRVLGGAFIPGTRSVIFVEGHGTGPYCYGTAVECNNDTVMTDVKGPHAQPYRYQILAYDANDLKRVKDGLDPKYTPLPYNKLTPWVLSEISGTGSGEDPRGHGTAFDPETGRLYIRTLDGNQPTIWVYQVTVGGGGSTGPPGGLRAIHRRRFRTGLQPGPIPVGY